MKLFDSDKDLSIYNELLKWLENNINYMLDFT